MNRKQMYYWSNATCHPANSTSSHLVVGSMLLTTTWLTFKNIEYWWLIFLAWQFDVTSKFVQQVACNVSVATCRESWVVGRGRGSWVWIVGENQNNNNNNNNNKWNRSTVVKLQDQTHFYKIFQLLTNSILSPNSQLKGRSTEHRITRKAFGLFTDFFSPWQANTSIFENELKYLEKKLKKKERNKICEAIYPRQVHT